MFNRIIKVSVLGIASFLFFSCGKQHKAEAVVKEFINRNIAVKDYYADFLKIDSTTHIADSLINRMKLTAEQNKIFKKGITYGQDPKSGKYAFLPANIYIGKDTIYQTFYLDMELSHVVAFK